MAKIVIKRRVDLDFLGTEYEKSFFVFKSIALGDFEKKIAEIETAKNDNSKSVRIMVQILQENFVEGEFQGEKVEKEDLEQLDIGTAVKCFEVLTGQDQSPKD